MASENQSQMPEIYGFPKDLIRQCMQVDHLGYVTLFARPLLPDVAKRCDELAPINFDGSLSYAIQGDEDNARKQAEYAT